MSLSRQLPEFTPAQLQLLTPPELRELLRLTERLKYVTETNKLQDYRPYPKQKLFHDLGATVRERLFMASNQTGKTWAGASETAFHLTGRYPDWWKGRRFNHPTRGIAGSESGELTKRGVQRLLLGNPETPDRWGTGSIPKETIVSTTLSPHVRNLVSAVVVKHCAGGESVLTMASYDQGRTKWQADTLDFVWFDEEPPEDVYIEGITRTNVSQGPVWITFTPLMGMSAVVRRFYPTMTAFPDTAVVHADLNDAEHYTPEQRQRVMDSYPEHERKARAKGIPSMGSGLVFGEVDEDDIRIAPFPIPQHWVQICGLDVGWEHPSAGARLAWDKDNDVIYVIAGYRKKHQTPLVFAGAVKPWGEWIPWAWPPDAKQDGQKFGSDDTRSLAKIYRGHGLSMLPVHAQNEDGTNSVEAGIQEMTERMMTGRWKVFGSVVDWFEEFRTYHRKDGLIVREADDLICASRYAYMMRRFAKVQNKPGMQRQVQPSMPNRNNQGWMG